MIDVRVIDDPAAAEVSLEPVRTRLLAELAQPGSASTLAAKVGLARQKVNYHLRALERHGLVELVEERRKGNMTERVMRASAASYVISPAALAAVAPDPDRAPDQLSALWLLALAARLVKELGELMGGARAAVVGSPRSGSIPRSALPRLLIVPRSPPSSQMPSRGSCPSTTTSSPAAVASIACSSCFTPASLGRQPRTTTRHQYQGVTQHPRRHDMSAFDCSRQIVVPATPDRVWEAVATTEGNPAWLFPNQIDPDGAGAKAWNPPNQFAIRQEQGDWFNALEFIIEDRGDGTSALRYVHRGVFPPEGFDTQNEAIQQHTDFYLHTLGEYLVLSAAFVRDARAVVRHEGAGCRSNVETLKGVGWRG